MSSMLEDADLTQAPEPQEPEEKEEETQEQPAEEQEPENAGEALINFPGAPDRTQIEEWKQQFGEVLVSGFSPTELFIFRPISRQEFVNLQTLIAQQEQGVSQFDVEQKICSTCVLWASEPGIASLETKAGSLSTLHEQILQASNFVDPRYAAAFVVKL